MPVDAAAADDSEAHDPPFCLDVFRSFSVAVCLEGIKSRLMVFVVGDAEGVNVWSSKDELWCCIGCLGGVGGRAGAKTFLALDVTWI